MPGLRAAMLQYCEDEIDNLQALVSELLDGDSVEAAMDTLDELDEVLLLKRLLEQEI